MRFVKVPKLFAFHIGWAVAAVGVLKETFERSHAVHGVIGYIRPTDTEIESWFEEEKYYLLKFKWTLLNRFIG